MLLNSKSTTYFSTVTYTVRGTPTIERFSTKAQAEKRAKEVAEQLKVPVRIL